MATRSKYFILQIYLQLAVLAESITLDNRIWIQLLCEMSELFL